jgi:peptidoglycan/xylan/chitin deacetylase (PgdA/CDA1 family)
MSKIINYQNIKIITILLIIVFIGFFFKISLWFLLIPFLFFNVFVIFGTFCIDSQFYTKVICKFESSDEIALTFDDGPNSETTEKILDILKENQAKATFFCVGEKIKQFPEIFQRIVNENHTIGNHTLNHNNFFGLLSYKKVNQEISETDNLILKYSDTKNILFRPPVGIVNPIIAKVCKTLNLKIIGWSLRSLDTVKSPNDILRRLQRVKAGNIILLHDNRENTPEILAEFLRLCKERNLKCISLNEILKNEK